METIYHAATNNAKQSSDSGKPLSQHILDDIKQELKAAKGSRYSFYSFPKQYSFETQDDEEQIILLLRPHFVVNIPWILLTIAMLMVPVLLPFVPVISFLPPNFQLITVILWYLFVLSYAFESFLSWYFDIYLVSDERVIDIDFFSLMYKQITSAKLDKIEDISYTQGGFSQSMLNYGKVLIQTAGEFQNIVFEDIPEPARVVKVINALVQQEEQELLEGRVK